MKRPIVLAPHDPHWADLFDEEREALKRVGRGIVEIHHIGSTAIPGIAAKPIIDILVVLARHEDGPANVEPMQRLGYEYRGEGGVAGRHYFRKGSPHTHHVHMFEAGHPEVGRDLRFRDYLRAHRDEARAYEALKRQLAARFGSNTLLYCEAKQEFCERIKRLASAAATAGSRHST
jgi:GrpB-like predicted nucleotidyltransferase (UPF0157 family)